MENVISNAERRAIRNDEKLVVPRISDVYAALPAITGKLELEYEGEMKGADFVGRELIRAAIAKTYDEYFTGANVQQIVQWFDLGGEIQLSDSYRAVEALENLKGIQGLIDKLGPLGVSQKESPEQQVSAAEFILEGLHAHKRIGRNEERVFKAGEKKPEPAAREDISRRKNRRTGREGSSIRLSAFGLRPTTAMVTLSRLGDSTKAEALGPFMKRIRYSKYVPDPAGEMSMEDLLGALSDYLLQSGFQSDMWYEMPEGEQTLDELAAPSNRR